ncbi:MAG TPA: patatin [Gammaproteobacteria bacterium]|nr:patatin [Gammaproteobacteria bacterium]
MHYSALKISCVYLCVVIIATGCSSLPERNPLPESLSDAAEIPGIAGARHWADEPPPEMDDWFKLTKEQLKTEYPAAYGQAHNYLAISGGGQRGAFGAGLLCGWTVTGSRPEFTMVTGVSTGALIAPFAFLGPEYDHVIKEIYTGFSTKDIVEQRSILKTLLGDAATDSWPLQEKIAKYIDEDVMAAIAAEHEKGRVLGIVTTNLDTARPVAWNIGRIAASGSPEALQLIRDVMLASASIPAAFPPVMFDVEADGQRYDELHVDGGATSVLYLYPIGLDWGKLAEKLEVKGKPNVYILRNGRWRKHWKSVDRSTIPIAIRTIDSLMGSAVLGDSYRIYLATQRDGIQYNLAYIPESFNEKSSESFDKEYMTKLFNLGHQMAIDGYQWNTVPPGYDKSSW